MGLLGNIANQYPIYSSEDIIRHIGKYDVVSFDIFDTLIKRTVASTNDVFFNAAKSFNKLYCENISLTEFVNDRIKADGIARLIAHGNNIDEVTINDIYAYLPEKYESIKDNLMLLEQAEELRCCKANSIIKRVYDWCINNNKIIYIVSDMYLPIETIKEMLNKCGYINFKRIYLSSEEKIQKRNGKLYKHLIEMEGIRKRDIIHIGDNNKVDFLQSRKNGINALKIARNPQFAKHTNCRRYSGKIQDIKTLEKFFNNCIDPTWNKYYWYGFEVMGPLLYGFAVKIQQYALENKIEKILFMARDGFLLKKIYNSVFCDMAVNNEYFYVSRRSISFPLLWIHPEFEDFLNNQNLYRTWNCKAICYRCGIDYEEGLKKWLEFGLLEDKEYYGEELLTDNRAKCFYNYFKKRMVQKSKDEYRLLCEYLKSIDFDKKILLVDTGGTCTSQKYFGLLQEHSQFKKSLKGLYLWYGGKEKPDVDAFFYPYDNLPKSLWQTEIIEFPMTAPEGSTISYKKHGKEIIPSLEEYEYKNDNRTIDVIDNIQRGAVYSAELMSIWKNKGELSAELSGYNAWRVSCYPKISELQIFSNIKFYNDNMGSPLYVNRPYFEYISDFKKFIEDYKRSYWKMGYIKNVFKLPIPYYSIKRFIKKFRNKKGNLN